jgi:predicted ATPase
MNMELYVISGCSGSGKSTLIDALAGCGELTVPEPGRAVVREQLASGGDGLPWQNLARFVELCAHQAILDFDRHAAHDRRTFFDRSLIDLLAAVERHHVPVPPILASALTARSYARIVFMSPPWPELFAVDAERRHTFAAALAEYDSLLPAYRRHGHEIIMLPQGPVRERVAFVLATLETMT